MKIGIVGAGNVGGTLGKILVKKGYEVVFGVRDPESPKVQATLEATGGKARAASVKEAAEFGEVLILATPWNATPDAIAQAGDLTGKIIIDAVNPLELTPAGLAAGLTVGHTTSAAEEIAKLATGASVVKALNNIGASCFENPQFGTQRATAFICGDSAAAKKIVANLMEEIGFEAIDAGDLKQARLLEPVGMLWIHLAFNGMGQDFSISLVKR
ncbi:MAG: NADPH-dependent F420 reductase [Oscillatoriaceae cyanobacterium Prado104]|jgi:hypothetical protein|nr:NADPH-dependent F420 reductase [Oscillatoriaceae cyanobacterium Prado104]